MRVKTNGRNSAAHRYAICGELNLCNCAVMCSPRQFLICWTHSCVQSSTPNTSQDDIHADAETAAPASAAESTALPSHPENATVGVISLDEIDEDDPFHDDVTLGLADGTAAERLDSRRARMERLEEKRLQDEEKQHAMNNPFGQVVA